MSLHSPYTENGCHADLITILVSIYNFLFLFQITDETDDATSGEVIMLNGGVQDFYVNLQFKSHRRDMKYQISLYTD